MKHPDVGLPVAAAISLAIDPERCEAGRNNVLTAFREREPRPPLPLGHRSRDAQRMRLGLQDLGAEPLAGG